MLSWLGCRRMMMMNLPAELRFLFLRCYVLVFLAGCDRTFARGTHHVQTASATIARAIFPNNSYRTVALLGGQDGRLRIHSRGLSTLDAVRKAPLSCHGSVAHILPCLLVWGGRRGHALVWSKGFLGRGIFRWFAARELKLNSVWGHNRIRERGSFLLTFARSWANIIVFCLQF